MRCCCRELEREFGRWGLRQGTPGTNFQMSRKDLDTCNCVRDRKMGQEEAHFLVVIGEKGGVVEMHGCRLLLTTI